MPNDKMSFYIQGGRYKGKKLFIPKEATTRATKSIIRGSLFNTLQQDIVNQIFIEVFAGSGSMGFEALSRGAKEAYFIEKEKSAYEVLRKNSAIIDKENSHLSFGNSFELYEPLIQTLRERSLKAFIYFDPPFDIREGMDDIYDKVVEMIKKTPSVTVLKIIVEHNSKIDFADRIGDFMKIKKRKFGKTTLTYFTLA